MTKTFMRFIKIRNNIIAGKYDEMKLYDFAQSLNIQQANDLISDAANFCHNKQNLYQFIDALLPLLREEVAINMIRESMKNLSDMGFCTPAYDKDGNIIGVTMNEEQSLRSKEFLKGGEG